jgi:hypothetical protein
VQPKEGEAKMVGMASELLHCRELERAALKKHGSVAGIVAAGEARRRAARERYGGRILLPPPIPPPTSGTTRAS